MFYEGSLQEGISTAVGQQKLVLCFVTDEKEESQTWENEFLGDEALSKLIQTQAVALRLLAGTEEAGYLAQIFPLPKTPTVVIMKHGELKEYIPAGTSKEDFFRRLQSAFNVSTPAAAASSSSPSSLANGLAAFVPMRRSPSPQPAAAQNQTLTQPEDAPSEAVSRVLAERVARLKEKEKEREEAERKAKEERAKEAQQAREADPVKNEQAKALAKLKKQKENDRKRILKNIDDDKQERRLRAHEIEMQRIDKQQASAAPGISPETKLPSMTRNSESAALQVRLFDGSTIRSRFKTAATLSDVRSWVNENKGENRLPYTFKQVLTPLPNKNIDQTEEGKTLGELGLVPSSTLVLIPIQRYSTAYERGSQGGFGFFALIALISSFFTWLAGLLGLSGRGETRRQSTSVGANEGASASSRDRRRYARDSQNPSNRRQDQQLYNGNSLNFEPRPGDDDDER